MTLLPARADLALGLSCSRCSVRERCYRSPHTRAQATGEAQNWMETTPRPDGPCEEWWSVETKGLADIFREAFGPEHGFEPLGAEFNLTAAQMAELHEP